ncbi:MAG TPA: kelch repeat-containing protein [Candidatus Dormibacteraeota bacterium]|nr:kelch repeat-containing protein [Candidatus Dormibacteraeota bacterium]
MGRSSRFALAIAVLLAGCASPSVSPPASSAPTATAAPTIVESSAPTATPTVPAWRELTPSGDAPFAREDHTWTLTPDGETAYLFGGRGSNGGPLGDLWAYDLSANGWTPVTEDGPPARFGHNAAWVDGVGLVLFAGQAGATFYNDLWAFDPAAASWQQLPAGGAVPVPRYGSCAAIGPDGRLWISHGFTQEGQRFADTRAYDFSIDTWTDETPTAGAPIERCLHACWWTDDDAFALYAGQTTGTNSLDDLWRLTVGERPGTNTWTELAPDGESPPARNLYAAARFAAGTVIVGGQALDGSALADSWYLADDGSARPLAIEGTSPPPRWAAELVSHQEGGRLLLFGGRDTDGARNDVWELAVGGSTIP